MADATMPGDQGGEGYGLDLNPDFLAGQNRGLQGSHPEKADDVRTAYDIKNLHNRLNDFEDDDLKGIPVLPPGTALEQRATYIDLRESQPKEIKARAGMKAGQKNWYVPKSEVDYVVWNRLIGVTNPERLDQADEGASDAPKTTGRGRGGSKSLAATAQSTDTGEQAPPRTRRRASASSAAGNASGPGAEVSTAGEYAGSPDQGAQFVGLSGGVPEADSGEVPRSQSYGNELH
jgi:hypothetical protein